MGLTQKLGTIPLAIQTDSSNNVGIGGAANASYKLAVTGASLFTGAGTFNNAVSLVSSAPTLNLSSTSANGINEIYFNRNTSSLIGYMAVGVNSTITGSGDEFIIDNRASGGGLIFRTNNAGTSAARMTITASGNVGIGASNITGKLMLYQGSAGNVFQSIVSNQGGSTRVGINLNPSMNESDAAAYQAQSAIYATDYNYSANIIFATKTEGAYGNSLTERMRITSGGYTKISNTGSYEYVNASIHEVRNSAADYILYGTNPHASNPSGYYISYPSASPNNTSNYFIACADSSAARFRVASNGNCYNVTGTYTSGVSDIRYKEQIVDANSQWNDIKSLRVVNFKFIKDVEENGENALRQIGFIAQEVEEVSPNLVDEMYDEKTGESWKTIKASIIHLKAVKALQEAMARIEELEAKITALENK